MHEKYKIGDFGEMSFVQVFKKHNLKLEFGKVMYGTIMETDPKYVRFCDNDGFEYLVEKVRIRKFDLKTKPEMI